MNIDDFCDAFTLSKAALISPNIRKRIDAIHDALMRIRSASETTQTGPKVGDTIDLFFEDIRHRAVKIAVLRSKDALPEDASLPTKNQLAELAPVLVLTDALSSSPQELAIKIVQTYTTYFGGQPNEAELVQAAALLAAKVT